MKAIRRFTVRTVLPESLNALEELAANLRWSWHQPTLDLFRDVAPELWAEQGKDPIGLLGEVPSARLAELAADAAFVARADGLRDELRAYLAEPRWYQALDGDAPGTIAYFSPGVRDRGGAPAVQRRPRHPGRRSPEERVRPRRAHRRRRPVLPRRLLPPGDLARGLAGGELSGARPRRPADGRAAQRRRLGRERRARAARRRGAHRPHLAAARRPRVPAAARHRRARELGGAARRHRPPLRRRRRAPPAAGAAARHRRRPRREDLHRARRASRPPRCSTPTRVTPDSRGSSASAT